MLIIEIMCRNFSKGDSMMICQWATGFAAFGHLQLRRFTRMQRKGYITAVWPHKVEKGEADDKCVHVCYESIYTQEGMEQFNNPRFK